MKLSIFIPTYKRKEKFERLYRRVLPLVSEDIELVVACSSPEYFPTEKNICLLKTEGYTREENYLYGIEHCQGNYTIIIEDDDLINTQILFKFVQKEQVHDLYIYDIINQSYQKSRNGIYTSSYFLENFYSLYQNSFQWGQCITRTSLLKNYMTFLWKKEKVLNLIQADELITLLVAKNSSSICLSEKKLLWVGIGIDNYSWNQKEELLQRNKFLMYRKKYLGF